MTQYLYLIRSQEFYKIGVANDVESRLASLQTGNPQMLTVEVVYGFDNAEIVERAIHQKFGKQRGLGEWFSLTQDQITDFEKICIALGGQQENGVLSVDSADLEEAEDVSEYLATIEDVKKIMCDPNYRVESRHDESGKVRGFAWRSRTGARSSPLFVGKSNPIFEEVKKLLSYE